MAVAKIAGWEVGAKTISAIRELQVASNFGLAESKLAIEKVIAGETVFITIADRATADEFSTEMRAHGFVVVIS